MREDLSAASKHIRTLMEPNVAARVFSIGSKADEAAFTAAEPEFSRGEIAMFDRGFSAPRVRRYVGAPSRPSSARSAPSAPRSCCSAPRHAGRPAAYGATAAAASATASTPARAALRWPPRAPRRTAMALLGEEAPPETTPVDARRRSAPARRPTTRWPPRATRSTRAHDIHVSCSTNSLSLRPRPRPPRLTTAMTTRRRRRRVRGRARGGGGRGGGALARRVSIDARGPSLRRRDGDGAMLRGRRAAGGRRGVAHCLARATAAGAPEDELVANPTAEYEVRFPVSRAPALLADALAGAPPRSPTARRRATPSSPADEQGEAPRFRAARRSSCPSASTARRRGGAGRGSGVALAIFDRHCHRAASSSRRSLRSPTPRCRPRTGRARAGGGGRRARGRLPGAAAGAGGRATAARGLPHAKRAVLWILTPGGGALQPLLPPGARKKVAAAAAALAVPLHGHPHGLVLTSSSGKARAHAARCCSLGSPTPPSAATTPTWQRDEAAGWAGLFDGDPLFSRRAADGGGGGDGDDDAGGGRVIGVLRLLGKEAGGGMFTPREEAVSAAAPRVAASSRTPSTWRRRGCARPRRARPRARRGGARGPRRRARRDSERARQAARRRPRRELESAHARLAKLDAEKRGSDEAIARLEAQRGGAAGGVLESAVGLRVISSWLRSICTRSRHCIALSHKV